MRDRSARLLQQTREFDRANLAIAKDALRKPEKYPHLTGWAELVIRRLEPVSVQQSLFRAA